VNTWRQRAAAILGPGAVAAGWRPARLGQPAGDVSGVWKSRTMRPRMPPAASRRWASGANLAGPLPTPSCWGHPGQTSPRSSLPPSTGQALLRSVTSIDGLHVTPSGAAGARTSLEW